MSKHTSISAEEFVEAWQKAESIEEMADKFGTEVLRLSSRAAVYRAKGVPLKKFVGRGKTIDIAMLTQLAKDSGPTGEHAPRKTVAAKTVKKSKKKAKA